LITVEGYPSQNIKDVKKVVMVMKGGVLYKNP